MILYITGTFPNWSETFIAQELRLLAATGVPLLHVAIRRGQGSTPDGVPEPVYLTNDRPGTDSSRGLSLPIPKSMRRKMTLRRHSAAVLRLTELVDEHRPTLLFAAFADLPGILTAHVARTCSTRYAISIHARDALVPKFDDQFLYGGAESVFVCNQRVHDAFVHRCPDYGSKTHLVHHGLELERWPMTDKTFNPDPVVNLLFVGRLIEKKGVDRAITLIGALHKANVAARLTIIGDGPERDASQAMVPAKLHDAIEWCGVRTPSEVATYMATADLLLVPSRRLADGDTEGIPNVILEAMASGLPVLASNVGSITEVVREDTGYVIDPDDIDAVIACLAEMISDRAAVDCKRHAARQLIESRFDAGRLIQLKAKRLLCNQEASL